MKRIAISLLLAIVLLCMPLTAFASTFSVSPSSEQTIEVPKDGTTTLDFTFPGYEGEVTVGKENLPLDIAPLGLVDISSGEVLTMTFTGDGTNNTYNGKLTFLASGEEQVLVGIKVRLTVHINCTTEVVAPAPSGSGARGSGGNGAIIYGIESTLFGIEKTYYTGYDGGISETVEATSEDGNLTITIPEGTAISNEKGDSLKTLGVVVNETPPEPPEDANIIGLTYDFSPSGAIFEPPITFTWSYDPTALPEGIVEGNLGLAYHDGEKWVELECVVDTKTNTIMASVAHFTTFAVIGFVTPAPIPAPVLAPPPSPPAPPALAPPPYPAPTPPIVITPAPAPAPALELEPPVIPEPTTNSWYIIIGLLVVGAAIVTILLVRRKRSRTT